MDNIENQEVGRVVEFQVNYGELTSTFKKRAPYTYDLCLFLSRHEQLKKLFVAKKINKPTSKGTSVTYKAIGGDASSEIKQFEEDFEYIKTITKLSEKEIDDGLCPVRRGDCNDLEL